MRWCLALRQGETISDHTAIAVGSLERVIRAADEKYHLLTAQEHPDHKVFGGRWKQDWNGRPLPYSILPLGCLPAERRGGRG